MARILVVVLAFFCVGTTYVIEENGVEVGRWEEPDGRDEVKVVASEVSRKDRPQKLKAPEIDYDSPGYALKETEMPEGEVQEWRISGQVVDIIRLRGIAGAELTFAFGGQNVQVTSDGEGYFRTRLPAFESGGYMITADPPEGYDHRAHLQKKRHFSDIPYRDRLAMLSSIQAVSFDEMQISGNAYEIQVGLLPLQLTEKETEDYNRIYLGHEG